MFWLLAGYMWLFIHRPFEVWPVLGTLHIERVYMIVTILCWTVAADKTWIKNRLNTAFMLFWLAVLAAWLVSPYGAIGAKTVEDYFKIVVFYLLVMSTVRDERDLKRLAIAFLVAMSLYMGHSLREFLCGRHWYKMDTVRMIGVDATYNDPNSFGATVLYAIPMVYPLWLAATRRWHRWALAGYVALAVTCILLTGSRSAFVGLCFLGLLAVGLLKKYRVKLALLFAIAAPVIWVNLRPDLQNRFLTLYDPSYGPPNAQASAEGRKQGWLDGVRLWRERPVFGVGPGAFGVARGTGMESHHLYGQVLGELGTAGALAFALVVFGFIANALECRRRCRVEPQLRGAFPTRVVSAVTVTVVLLLVLGFGGHNLYRYTWLWFGAFQAIALDCLRRAQEVDLAATAPIQPDEIRQGSYA
jgi:O-antigen ligase